MSMAAVAQYGDITGGDRWGNPYYHLGAFTLQAPPFLLYDKDSITKLPPGAGGISVTPLEPDWLSGLTSYSLFPINFQADIRRGWVNEGLPSVDMDSAASIPSIGSPPVSPYLPYASPIAVLIDIFAGDLYNPPGPDDAFLLGSIKLAPDYAANKATYTQTSSVSESAGVRGHGISINLARSLQYSIGVTNTDYDRDVQVFSNQPYPYIDYDVYWLGRIVYVLPDAGSHFTTDFSVSGVAEILVANSWMAGELAGKNTGLVIGANVGFLSMVYQGVRGTDECTAYVPTVIIYPTAVEGSIEPGGGWGLRSTDTGGG